MHEFQVRVCWLAGGQLAALSDNLIQGLAMLSREHAQPFLGLTANGAPGLKAQAQQEGGGGGDFAFRSLHQTLAKTSLRLSPVLFLWIRWRHMLSGLSHPFMQLCVLISGRSVLLT